MSIPPEDTQAPAQESARDPYPKMITACIIIALVLLGIIFATLYYDFSHRDLVEPPVLPTNGQTAPLEATISAQNPAHQDRRYAKVVSGLSSEAAERCMQVLPSQLE